MVCLVNISQEGLMNYGCLQLGNTSNTSGAIGALLPLDRGEPSKLAEVRLKADVTEDGKIKYPL